MERPDLKMPEWHKEEVCLFTDEQKIEMFSVLINYSSDLERYTNYLERSKGKPDSDTESKLNIACVINWVATKDEQPPVDTNILTRSMYGNVKDNNLMKGNKLDAHWFPYWMLDVEPPCL